MNKSHKRCLRIVYSSKISNFEGLLERDGSVSIDHQNIRILTIEMFKVFKWISPKIVNEIFQFRDAVPYQLRKQTDSQTPSVHSVFIDVEIIKFHEPKI